MLLSINEEVLASIVKAVESRNCSKLSEILSELETAVKLCSKYFRADEKITIVVPTQSSKFFDSTCITRKEYSVDIDLPISGDLDIDEVCEEDAIEAEMTIKADSIDKAISFINRILEKGELCYVPNINLPACTHTVDNHNKMCEEYGEGKVKVSLGFITSIVVYETVRIESENGIVSLYARRVIVKEYNASNFIQVLDELKERFSGKNVNVTINFKL